MCKKFPHKMMALRRARFNNLCDTQIYAMGITYRHYGDLMIRPKTMHLAHQLEALLVRLTDYMVFNGLILGYTSSQVSLQLSIALFFII